MRRHCALVFALLLLCVGCAAEDPVPTPTNNNGTNNGTNNGVTNNGVTNNGVTNNGVTNNGVTNNGEDMCVPLTSDYSAGADDEWPACISDDGDYHRFEEGISSAGRVAGFEQIADILWRNGTPSTAEFLDAREVYAADQGLDSRIQRREDEHYPAVSGGEGGTLKCRDEGVPAMDPDRCVGPGKILPIINAAFLDGGSGNNPEVNAARIEGALLWFLYVSTHKEATTCAEKAKDCDSAYAYYTGDLPREGGIGLAGYLRTIDENAHDRVWDGILAVRCWRDLDSAETATDLETRDRAIEQLDTALLHGFAAVVKARLARFAGESGADRDAAWAFLQVAGPVLNRAAANNDTDAAAFLEAAWTGDADGLDVQGASDALDAAFPCP
jgi:major membrane immunogen (membrane-anchored lipoprotein)